MLFGTTCIAHVTRRGRRSLSNRKLENGKKVLDEKEKEKNGPKEERNNPFLLVQKKKDRSESCLPELSIR
jgi:hypothetical protein